MPMIISFASVLLIENTRTKTGGGAAVRAAEHSGAPRSGRGGNRFSQKIGGHPRALRAALAAVMLGLSRRAHHPPAIMARHSGRLEERRVGKEGVRTCRSRVSTDRLQIYKKRHKKLLQT